MTPTRHPGDEGRRPSIAGHPVRRRWRASSLVLAALFAAGCATYSDKTEQLRNAAADGQPLVALKLANKLLRVKDDRAIPDKLRQEAVLVLLERGVLLQVLGRYKDSSRDLEVAERQLELLDIARDPGGAVSEWLFSASRKKYKATPVEKLSINAVNLVNYLARQDLEGARVEAKRFSVMRDYVKSYDPEHAHAAFGSYLAGLAYEKLGEADEALRYYDEALVLSELPSLRIPIKRLAAKGSYRTERLARYIDDPSPIPETPAPELVAIICVGRVPYKVPERMPIGLAVGLAGSYVTGDPAVLGVAGLKWVVYPELAPSNSRYDSAHVRVDGVDIRVEQISNIGADVEREYNELKPRLVGSAITRMITRAAAAEAARAAGTAAGSSGKGGGGVVAGWLAALAVEGALLAADKPDTRSWTLLPGRVLISRTELPPGEHMVEIWLYGPGGEEYLKQTVTVPAQGMSVVQVTSLR